jgi:cytochrome b involved in lipid metabolism
MNDLVIDVKNYYGSHPGGSFLMEKNVGRDIAKYFDGGY